MGSSNHNFLENSGKALLSGNEAIARGFWEAGGIFASGYPGTPGTEILEAVSLFKEIHAQWATNEKVALEVAIGVALAGGRCLVSMKHVGVNVAADPLATLPYLGIKGALVIVSADDPGPYSSQNEQDNRHYARFFKIPLLEPSDSDEALRYCKEAVCISQRFSTPVMLRVTTRICHTRTVVGLGPRDRVSSAIGFSPNPETQVMIPKYARLGHKNLEERLKKLEEYSEGSELNKEILSDNHLGIISSGISFQYAKETNPGAGFLKLGMSWPLPAKKIRDFAKRYSKVVVLEELDRFLEKEIKSLGISVYGKPDRYLLGELNPSRVREIFKTGKKDSSTPSPSKRSPGFCPGCAYEKVFKILSELDIYCMGDIGCYTLGALPPFKAIHANLCMGASIGLASGLSWALGDRNKKVIAVIGDSTFLHAGIPSLMDAVYNRRKTKVIILDNMSTAMTGFQEHPGTGMTLEGDETKKIDIASICVALGVDKVMEHNPYEPGLREKIKALLEIDGSCVLILKAPCLLHKKHRTARALNKNEDRHKRREDR